MLRLRALAVGVEFLGERADFRLLLFRAVGEGERIEAATLRLFSSLSSGSCLGVGHECSDVGRQLHQQWGGGFGPGFEVAVGVKRMPRGESHATRPIGENGAVGTILIGVFLRVCFLF